MKEVKEQNAESVKCAGNGRTNFRIERGTKVNHSGSFYAAMVIAVFMLFYYYFTRFTANINATWTGVLVLVLIGCVDIFLFYQIRKAKVWTKKSNRILLALLFFFLVSFLVNLSGVQRFFLFIMVLLAVYLFIQSPISFREAQILFWFYALFVFLILLKTATGRENAVELNKFNPNTGGFLLSLLFCASFLLFLKCKYFANKILYLLVCALSFGLQFVFISRTALLGIVMFFLATVLFRAYKKTCKRKAAFWFVLLLSVLGVVVAYVYAEILFPSLGYGKLVIFGKDIFTGRQTIWSFTFDSVKEHFWFGVGSSLNEDKFNEGYYELIMNAHNQPLGVLAASGIFVFVMFYYALSNFTSLLYQEGKDIKFSRIPLVYMCVITIMSYFDIYFMTLFNVLPILAVFAMMVGAGRITEKDGSR